MTVTRMGALRLVDPDAWADAVKYALLLHNGSVGDAARQLGVSRRQLTRWLAEMPQLVRAKPGRPKRATE